VRLPGQGGPGARRRPGDLYLRITVREHPTVRVQGRDLLLDLPIHAREALAGAEVTAPTFEGPGEAEDPARIPERPQAAGSAGEAFRP